MTKAKVAKIICPYCYKPSIDGFTHYKCGKKYGIDGLLSVWEYDGVIKKALLATKYKYATSVGSELSEYFYNFLVNSKARFPKFDLLIPIPLYWYKENVRGFNQSSEFGSYLSQKMGWVFSKDFVVRKRHTKTQALLNKENRLVNLKDAFEINKEKHFDIKSVAIIDDVFTTGATLKECAKVIKKHGIEKVWGLAVASRSTLFG